MKCERTLRDVFQDKKISLGELSAKADSHTLNNKHIQDIRSLPLIFSSKRIPRDLTFLVFIIGSFPF